MFKVKSTNMHTTVACGVSRVRALPDTSLYFHKSLRLLVGSGTGCPPGCLGGLLARRLLSALALVASGSVLSGLPQSSLPAYTPAGSPTPDPYTAVFEVCCWTVTSQSFRRSHLSVRLSTRLPSPYQRALSGLPVTITRTALILVALKRLFGTDS